MGGDISVQSTPGVGSTFNVTLPMVRVRDSSRRAGHTASETVAANSDLRILVAEDNAVNQLVLKTLLGQAGLRPVIVSDGEAAVAAWEGGVWDLILMDVQMPVMDGVTAVREIRRKEIERGRPATPVLALTANAMTYQVEEYHAAGMDGVVAKPIEVASLFEAMDAALTQAASHRAA